MFDPIKASILENTFGLEIMQDHIYIILNALPAEENQLLTTIREYQLGYTKLENHLADHTCAPGEPAQIVALNRDALTLTEGFCSVQNELLTLILKNQLILKFTPTLLSHMIREAEDYLQTLQGLLNPTAPIQHDNLFQLHLLRLPDAAGHAAALRNGLDPIENEIYQIASGFKSTFDQLIIKTAELNHMAPLHMAPLPIYNRLNQLILKNLKNFQEFLLSLKSLKNVVWF